MRREELGLLKELQALEFSAYDFVLYLDTHPGDQRALAEYSRLMNESKHLRSIYNSQYGPLMLEDSVNQPCWRWIEEPWPWEIEY